MPMQPLSIKHKNHTPTSPHQKQLHSQSRNLTTQQLHFLHPQPSPMHRQTFRRPRTTPITRKQKRHRLHSNQIHNPKKSKPPSQLLINTQQPTHNVSTSQQNTNTNNTTLQSPHQPHQRNQTTLSMRQSQRHTSQTPHSTNNQPQYNTHSPHPHTHKQTRHPPSKHTTRHTTPRNQPQSQSQRLPTTHQLNQSQRTSLPTPITQPTPAKTNNLQPQRLTPTRPTSQGRQSLNRPTRQPTLPQHKQFLPIIRQTLKPSPTLPLQTQQPPSPTTSTSTVNSQRHTNNQPSHQTHLHPHTKSQSTQRTHLHTPTQQPQRPSPTSTQKKLTQNNIPNQQPNLHNSPFKSHSTTTHAPTHNR